MPAPPPQLPASPRVVGMSESRAYLFVILKIIVRSSYYQPFLVFFGSWAVLTWTWAASNVLPNRCYISVAGVNPNYNAI
jgi:hypothetical protein